MMNLLMILKSNKSKKGFTLVEILISVSLFTVIVTISMGALLSIFDANRKTQSLKTVMDNLNLALEDMSRTVRFAEHYHCGNTGTLGNPRDCENGDSFLAVTFEGRTVVYRQNGSAIQRSNDGGLTYANVNSSDTVIENLKFYVFGTQPGPGDVDQPYVLAVIKGYAGSPGKPRTRSDFSIQTLMSQRALDTE